MHDDPTPRIPWSAGVAIWLALAVLFTMSQAATYAVKGQPEPLLHSAWWGGGEWLVYGLLAPVVMAVARRWPLRRPTLLRHVGILLVGWVAFHVASEAIYTAVDVTLQIGADPATPRQFMPVLVLYLSKKAGATLLVFAGIVTVAHLVALYGEIRVRERETAGLEAALARARLDALRGQLQPHFLFNALNTVSSLMVRDPEAAERVLTRLGDLLRMTLQEGGSPEVPLERELAFVERYLDIQRVRFADRLSVIVEIEPGTEQVLVPTLLLQPLVENAIRHGIEPRATAGTVTILARRAAGALDIRVRDDGVGITGDGTNGHGTGGHGVGLVNTRARLTELYPDRHTFEVVPAIGGGTEVRITLPWRENPADHG